MLVGSNYSAFFFLTQYLQGALGFSALHAGLAFLPMTLTMFAVIRIVPRIVERTGGSALIVTGLATSIASVAARPRFRPTRLLPGHRRPAGHLRRRHGPRVRTR